MGKQIRALHVYKKDANGRSVKRPTGSRTWELLNDEILSEKGKEIVREDPNLGNATMQQLIDLQNAEKGMDDEGESEKVPFSFGTNSKGEGNERNNIGIPLLSSCIKDDLRATWAEITARYAAIRRISFIETAIELKKLEKERGLYYFTPGTQIPVRWVPTVVSTNRKRTEGKPEGPGALHPQPSAVPDLQPTETIEDLWSCIGI